MAAGLNVPTTFTAVDKFTSVVKNMNTGVSSFGKKAVKSIKKVDKSINKQVNSLDNLNKMLLGIGVGALFKKAFDDAKKFETGLVGVGKTTNTEGEKLKQFGFDIIKTSGRLKTISTEKLLELAQSAGQLGVQQKDILKFSETMAKLEKASSGTVVGEEGASVIARILNVTKEGPGIIDKFASSLVHLGNNSAATEGEILEVANEVGRSTAAYSLSSTKVLGLSAAMKSLGVAPQAAGSAIGKTFRAIELATIRGGETLENFAKISGVSSQDFKKAFEKDPASAFSMFIKGLNRIGKEGGSMTKAMLDVNLAGEIVGKGILPLAGSIEVLDKSMKLANDGFTQNIALNKEFEAANSTVQAGLDSIGVAFSNTINGTAQQGEKMAFLSSILFMVSDNMGVLINVVAALALAYGVMKAVIIASTIATNLQSVAIGVHTAVTSGSKRALIGNAVAMTAYRGAMLIGTAATWIATAATTAFGIALNLGLWPIVLIIAAIAGLIALIMNWSSVTDWFGKKWEQFTNWISMLWDNVVKWFQNFDFKQFFMKIGQSIIKFMLFPMIQLLQLVSKIPGKIGEMATAGLEQIGKLTGEFQVNTPEKLSSPEQGQAETTITSRQEGNLNVNIRDRGGNVENTETAGGMPITVTETQGAF